MSGYPWRTEGLYLNELINTDLLHSALPQYTIIIFTRILFFLYAFDKPKYKCEQAGDFFIYLLYNGDFSLFLFGMRISSRERLSRMLLIPSPYPV